MPIVQTFLEMLQFTYPSRLSRFSLSQVTFANPVFFFVFFLFFFFFLLLINYFSFSLFPLLTAQMSTYRLLLVYNS